LLNILIWNILACCGISLLAEYFVGDGDGGIFASARGLGRQDSDPERFRQLKSAVSKLLMIRPDRDELTTRKMIRETHVKFSAEIEHGYVVTVENHTQRFVVSSFAAKEKEVVVYRILVSDDEAGTEWHVDRRFSDFFELDKTLKYHYPKMPISLPPKHFFGNTNQRLITYRKDALQTYLDQILSDEVMGYSDEVNKFLAEDDEAGDESTQRYDNTSFGLQVSRTDDDGATYTMARSRRRSLSWDGSVRDDDGLADPSSSWAAHFAHLSTTPRPRMTPDGGGGSAAVGKEGLENDSATAGGDDAAMAAEGGGGGTPSSMVQLRDGSMLEVPLAQASSPRQVFFTGLILTVLIFLTIRVLTVLVFLTERVLTVFMFLTELVLTVLICLTGLVLTVLIFSGFSTDCSGNGLGGQGASE
jgi:hypothetical protein